MQTAIAGYKSTLAAMQAKCSKESPAFAGPSKCSDRAQLGAAAVRCADDRPVLRPKSSRLVSLGAWCLERHCAEHEPCGQ
jgi:hypothetical protein